MEESNTIQEQPVDNASVPTPTPTPTPTPAPTPEELKREEIRKYYMSLQKLNYETCIEVVMSQTTYTRDEAIAGLEKYKGNVTHVVKEFLGIPQKVSGNNGDNELGAKSLNQKRYGVIRDFMDKAASSYIKTQERNKVVNQMMERQKKIREESLSLQMQTNANTIVSSAEPSTQS